MGDFLFLLLNLHHTLFSLSLSLSQGMFDNCLFSVHKPLTRDFFVRNADNISAGQSSALSPSSLADASTSTASLNTSTTAADDGTWTKMSHLKINGVPIDHINAGTQGPFSWITKGTLDIDMHFLTPNDNNQNSDLMDMLREEIEDIRDLALDKIEEVILTHPHEMVDARRVARREEEVRRLLQVFEEEKAATAAADANSAAMKTNGSLAKTKSSSSSSSGSTAATTTASTSSAPAKLIEPSRSTPIDDLEVLPLPRSFKLDCYGVQYPFADEAPQPLVISSDLNNLSTSSPPSSPSSTSSYQDPNSNIPQSKTLDTSISSSTLPSPSSSQNINNSNNIPTVVMFWNVKMNNLKVSVPLAPPELSYMSSAMIRPVVAYLNANRNTTPISFSAEMSLVRLL